MTRSWDSKLVREMLTRTRTDGGVISADDYRPEGLEVEFGMQQDGLYRLSETQAQEILQMRLQRLTGLEQDKIVAEYKEIMAVIEDLLDILAKPERVSTIIGEELVTIKTEFGQTKLGARRSQVEYSAQDLSTEDLITPTDMVVTLSHTGYIKSQPLSEYRSQKRGGRGKQATATKEDDWIDQLLSPTRTTTCCASPTGAACTGSRSGKCPLARAARVAALSSTCSHCKTTRRSTWCCPHRRIPQLPGRSLCVHGHPHGYRQEDLAG